jgi:hypothetical protein
MPHGVPISVFASAKNMARAAGGTWPNIKWCDSERFLRIVEQFVKGAIHEEAFSAHFPGGNTGDQCHVRSCSCHQTKGQPGVRNHLYRSQTQLSWRLFLRLDAGQWHRYRRLRIKALKNSPQRTTKEFIAARSQRQDNFRLIVSTKPFFLCTLCGKKQ